MCQVDDATIDEENRSVPEVVVDGVTGFVVRRPEHLAAAIRRIPLIGRGACRRHVAARFDLPVMVDGYERVFREAAAGSTPSVPGPRPRTVAGPPRLGDG